MSDLRMTSLAALALVMLVSGCAGSMGTMRGGPSMPAAEAVANAATAPVTAFDGSYRVTLRSTGSAGAAGNTSWCASPGQPTITVTNGQFSYAVPHPNVPGNATPVYSATIEADGTFYGTIVAGSLSGMVQGTRIQGRIDGSGCLYELSGTRV
jgi:hypothetical protein